MFASRKEVLVTQQEALPDRSTPVVLSGTHYVSGRPIVGPFPAGLHQIVLGMGCFWGAERLLWSLPGVYSTAVGYAGGYTAHPTYQDVCSGRTGHTEVVLVVYDPEQISCERLLQVFWEAHDPTQGMRQGNDRGTQYRSAIYTTDPTQAATAAASLARYQDALTRAGKGSITTELAPLAAFYHAEEYHQQYLARNPGGYCGLQGTGVRCPA